MSGSIADSSSQCIILVGMELHPTEQLIVKTSVGAFLEKKARRWEHPIKRFENSPESAWAIVASIEHNGFHLDVQVKMGDRRKAFSESDA